jgi:hypothetical protein
LDASTTPIENKKYHKTGACFRKTYMLIRKIFKIMSQKIKFDKTYMWKRPSS